MTWQYTPYTLPLLLIAIFSLVGAIFSFRNRKVRGGGPFAVLMAAVTWWLAATLLETNRCDATGRLFWTNMQYLGMVSTGFPA